MSERSAPEFEPQSADAVLMVRPACFAANSQTAASNAFQHEMSADGDSALQRTALEEFDGLAQALQRARVTVILAHDTETPAKPDALFPNNWVSFHRDGTVVLYPMLAPNRRPERRDDIIERVIHEGSYRITRTIDLSYRERQDKYLEGTGSLVLDRSRHMAYASLSPRTDLDVLGEFAQQLDYELITFEAFDPGGKAVYHTNVLMAIGARFAVLCSAAIPDPLHRAAVISKLEGTGHELVDIAPHQMLAFAGNVLELSPPGGNVIALSTTAWGSLAPAQRRLLEKFGSVVAVDIPSIERVGGGGVRCMLTEIHLPGRGMS